VYTITIYRGSIIERLLIFIVEMGKKNFDRKKAVRFSLVPGPVVDGKPTVLYKPV
jgi:hypothetical protein